MSSRMTDSSRRADGTTEPATPAPQAPDPAAPVPNPAPSAPTPAHPSAACGTSDVVGCEPVPAVRALRPRDLRPDPGLPAGRAFTPAVGAKAEDPADRPLTDDVAAAATLLDDLAGFVGPVAQPPTGPEAEPDRNDENR